MTALAPALVLLAVAAVAAVAWFSLPAPPAPRPVPATPPRWADHRSPAQRAADQARLDEALGLR